MVSLRPGWDTPEALSLVDRQTEIIVNWNPKLLKCQVFPKLLNSTPVNILAQWLWVNPCSRVLASSEKLGFTPALQRQNQPLISVSRSKWTGREKIVYERIMQEGLYCAVTTHCEAFSSWICQGSSEKQDMYTYTQNIHVYVYLWIASYNCGV